MAKKKKSREDGIFISFVDEPASEQVTGSMIYISTSAHNILVEAGCAQSNNIKEDYLVNNRKFSEFKPKNIDLIFLTHNHHDHCNLCPRLIRDGFEGGIITPVNSKKIQQIMYEDCLKIN